MKKVFPLLICVIFLFPVTMAYSNENIISEKIMILKSDVEHKEKWLVKENLVEAGKEAVVPLIEALKDKNSKYYAIRALGEIKDERAVDPLASILLDKDYGPRRYAAVALGSIKSPEAIPALKQALKNEKGYVISDVLTALQYIEPSEGKIYLDQMLSQQNPNGLEIKLSASKSLNAVNLTVTFRNISSSDFFIQWPEIYQATSLIIQDESGRFIRPLSGVKYDYMTNESEFKLIKVNEIFTVDLKGIIKTSPSAKISRSAIEMDWWNILYPKGPFKTIVFDDMEVDIDLLSSKKLKIYFLFEQGTTAQHWGNQFGYKNVWMGKTASKPVELEI